MIKQTTDLNEQQIAELESNHFSRRILSHFLAYGTRYDFCRFFTLERDNSCVALISVFNSAMVVCSFKGKTLNDEDILELSILVGMTKPFTVELDEAYSSALFEKIKDDYNEFGRVEFEFRCPETPPDIKVNDMPRLDDVFDILKTSFPIIKNTRELWLTDTSHRVRHGMSQCFTFGDFSSATIQYILDGIAFVGHVATVPWERGKHRARELLYWIGDRLNADGYSVRLYARDYNVSFYMEIGFVPVRSDKVYERKNID